MIHFRETNQIAPRDGRNEKIFAWWQICSIRSIYSLLRFLIALFGNSLHVGMLSMERAIPLFKWRSEYRLKNIFAKGLQTTRGCEISQHTKCASEAKTHEPDCRVSRSALLMPLTTFDHEHCLKIKDRPREHIALAPLRRQLESRDER
jgi:hypothetical protein